LNDKKISSNVIDIDFLQEVIMHYLFVPTIALVILSALTSSGYAEVYDWQYAGPGVSGSGVLTTDTSGFAQVTSISGTANGRSIVGLSGYDEPDNILFPAFPSLNPIVSSLGISFSVGDGSQSFNIESIGFVTCGGAEYCLIGPDDTSNFSGPPTPGTPIVGLTSFTVTSVPEASVWMMILAGFMGLGLVGRRRLADLGDRNAASGRAAS
jgi:hypothetical protein